MWTLYDVAKVCQESGKSNFVELVGTHDKEVKVPSYDWTSHLGIFFKKIPNIKEYQHFTFSKSQPGKVKCTKHHGDEATVVDILRSNVEITRALPALIAPMGFIPERKNYLFKEIRPFCRAETADLVAPPPL